MMLLFMQERSQMLKKFMLIQISYVLGPIIFVQHFLMNGQKKLMENLFLENQIFRLICLISSSGNIIYLEFCICEKNYIFITINILHRFIYCGSIELKNLQGPDVLKLLIAVDELNIQQLVSHIQEYLIKHQTEFLHQNPVGILETVYQHENFTDLWNFCLEKICEEPKILFNSVKFINLKAPLLELLLKRDDLNMEEIEIWESLLKWCFTLQDVNNNDPAKWSQ